MKTDIQKDVIDELYAIIKADAEQKGLGNLNIEPETARLKLCPAPTSTSSVDQDMSDKLMR